MGESGGSNNWLPIDARNSASGCLGCVSASGFSLSVAETVKHKRGSETVKRKNAVARELSDDSARNKKDSQTVRERR